MAASSFNSVMWLGLATLDDMQLINMIINGRKQR